MARLNMLIASAVFGLCACASYPEATVEQGAGASGLTVVGAPEGTILRVDGIDYGSVEQFDGKNALAVTPGKHRVELVRSGEVILTQDVFVGREGRMQITY
jgi:hypothetical protein